MPTRTSVAPRRSAHDYGVGGTQRRVVFDGVRVVFVFGGSGARGSVRVTIAVGGVRIRSPPLEGVPSGFVRRARTVLGNQIRRPPLDGGASGSVR